MKNWHKVFATISVLIIFAFSSSLIAGAQLDRPYDPVVVTGESLPLFLNAPVSELFVYVYKNGSWQQIPFQIDERDGGDFYGTQNGLLDADDEICFIAADMGDSVADYTWIDNPESYAYQRYQVRVTDINESPAKNAWAYIYRSSTLSYDTTLPVYMHYVPATDAAGNDTIKGVSYVFGHNIKSIPDYLAINSAVGGSGEDILDRWKIRFSGKLSGIFSYDENEETGLQFNSLKYKVGPVRVLRAANFYAVLNGRAVEDPVIFASYFYPYYALINTGERTLDQVLGMEVLRQSMDFTSNIVVSTFSSNNNDSVVVDGNPDVDVDNSLTVPGINWYMVRGGYGTVATVLNMPEIGETQELYYKDNSSVNINDTGDYRSYGECGILVTSYDSPIVGTFVLKTTMYFLGPNHTRALGDTLADRFANPPQITVTPREFVIPVELASFSAHVSEGKVIIEWITATESNNYGFQIERKKISDAEWEKIGFVEGKGTTTERNIYRFVDTTAKPGEYEYRLKQIDNSGRFTLSKSVSVTVKSPSAFSLEQNYPNPFNPTTEITFNIPSDQSGPVELKIFNLLGKEIRTFSFANLSAGQHKIVWDGRNNEGKNVSSGMFIYTLRIDGKTASRKMVKLQ